MLVIQIYASDKIEQRNVFLERIIPVKNISSIDCEYYD